MNKKTMIERIVEGTVGSKLKFDTLLHCDLHGGGREPIAQVAQESREVRKDDTKTNAEKTNLTPEQVQWLATASGDALLDSLLNMQFHNRFGCNDKAIANVRREILRRMGKASKTAETGASPSLRDDLLSLTAGQMKGEPKMVKTIYSHPT